MIIFLLILIVCCLLFGSEDTKNALLAIVLFLVLGGLFVSCQS